MSFNISVIYNYYFFSNLLFDLQALAKKGLIDASKKNNSGSTLSRVTGVNQTSKSSVQVKLPEKCPAKTEAVTTKPKPILRAKLPAGKKIEEKAELPSKVYITRRSTDVEKSEQKSDESSLYISALEEVPEENAKRSSRSSSKVCSFLQFEHRKFLHLFFFYSGFQLFSFNKNLRRVIRKKPQLKQVEISQSNY